MAVNPMTLLAIGALAAGGVGAAGMMGAGGTAAAAGAGAAEATGAVGATEAAAGTAAATEGAAASEAAGALGATEMAPEAVAAAEGGQAGFMDQLLTKLGGGNPKLGSLALAGLMTQTGAAIAGPDSAVGRAGSVVGKGFQGAAMAESAKMAQDKKNELFKSILQGMTPQGQPGHDEVKLMSDGTYNIKGQYGSPQVDDLSATNAPTTAPSATPMPEGSKQVSELNPWAQQVLG